MQTATANVVKVLTTRRTVSLPFSVVLKDFEVAKAAYLDNLEQDCIDDAESLALTNEMLDHAKAIWLVLLEDEPLFQRFVMGYVLEDELLFTSSILTAAKLVGDDPVRFFEANASDLFWDRFEFLRGMISSERLDI